MKLDSVEKKIVDSVQRGEWRSIPGLKEARKRHARYAARLASRIQLTAIRGPWAEVGLRRHQGQGGLWTPTATGRYRGYARLQAGAA